MDKYSINKLPQVICIRYTGQKKTESNKSAMRAYASHYIRRASENYGNRVGEYMCYLQGVEVAVYLYIHPCLLYVGAGLLQLAGR